MRQSSSSARPTAAITDTDRIFQINVHPERIETTRTEAAITGEIKGIEKSLREQKRE